MGFSDDVGKWTKGAEQKMKQAEKGKDEQMSKELERVLGPDANKITGGTFDRATGKLYNVKAPQDVIQKLKEAGLVGD